MTRRLAIFVLLLGSLAACGFQLRGPRPMPFKSIFLTMSPYADLAVSIKRQLRANGGVEVVDRADQAEVRLVVITDNKDKTILSLNSLGTVQEYQLRQRFAFRLVGKDDKEIIPFNEIYVTRHMSVDDSLVLAKDAEESAPYRDMSNDVVAQLMRRLSAAKM